MAIELPSFIVYRSSAGSGKTYSLVKQYLTLALKDPNPQAYSRILAITFTNNAASEMKDRIVSRLHDFSQMHSLPSTDGAWMLFHEIRAVLELDALEIEERAEALLSNILHNYSRFAVSTIDSFIHKIVRSFARDLGRHPDFDIQMDIDQVLEEVVDRCLDQVGRDPEITQYLKSLITFQMEEGRSWNPKRIMMDFSKSLVSEKGIQALERQDGMTLSQFSQVRLEINQRMMELERKPRALAQKAFDLLSSCSLNPEDHYYSGSGLYFKLGELAKSVITDPGANSLMKVPFSGNWPKAIVVNWARSSAHHNVKAKFDAVAQEVNECVMALYEWYHSPDFNLYYLIQRISRNFFALGLIHYLHAISEHLKLEKNFLMIDDFHQMVSKVIAENHAPFIYEKVGERFEHILFDEFQDTSQLQWRNFLPLVQECLSKEGSVFVVGDGKQSIYRWRNGNVQQFVELPHIVETPNINGLARAMQENFVEPSRGVNHNFRSAKNIVQFNNGVFEEYSLALGDRKVVYDGHAQEVKGKGNGMVQMRWCADKKDSMGKVCQGIIDIIQQCREDGFKLSDIAILTRKGKKESAPIAQAIKDYNALVSEELRITISTQDSFLLSLSPKVRLVMSYLTYLSAPRELYYRFDFIRSLAEVFPGQVDRGEMIDGCMELWQKNGKQGFSFGEIKKVILNWNDQIRLEWPTGKSAFEMAKSFIGVVDLDVDEYLEFLLDQLSQRSQNIGFQPAEMRRWWEKAKDKLCINASGTNDAVKMMTIHRSKGLEFPVVIYPRFNSQMPGGFLWINTRDSDLPIQDALVNYKPSKPMYFHPSDMREEYWDTQLDDANLIYVAQTRPTQRLYILQEFKEDEKSKEDPVSGEDTKKKSTRTKKVKEPKPKEEWAYTDFLMNQMMLSGEEISKNIWQIGKRESPLPEKEKANIPVQEMGAKMFNVEEKKLRLTATRKETLKDLWELGRKGEQLHILLQQFVLKANFETAVEKVQMSLGLLSSSRIDELKEIWNKAELNEQLDHYRKAAVKWSIEQTIVLSNGQEIRPDLFAWNERRDAIWLIDFKTGKPKEKDSQQILGYASALTEICNVQVQPAILYTQEMTWKNW